MDTYKIEISPRALELLQNSVNYIRDILLEPLAAQAVCEDALETVRELKNVAEALRLCSDPRLRSLGYHAARFRHHDYIMLYRIEGHTAYIDAVYHLRQDYERIFSRDLMNDDR